MLIEGRSDVLVPPNHGARAYAALNGLAEGAGSKLSYVEVTDANHFDIFTSVTPTAIVPLNLYLQRGLDAMYAHLKYGTPLPPSQLVRAVPRWSGFVPMMELNVPAIRQQVGEGERIRIGPGSLDVPD